jgi:5-methyltetrahydropteroyltriglutamate--homocysteine methyltransferase
VLAALSSKIIMLGVLDLSDMSVERPAIVADRIRLALPHIDANGIVVAPTLCVSQHGQYPLARSVENGR